MENPKQILLLLTNALAENQEVKAKDSNENVSCFTAQDLFRNWLVKILKPTANDLIDRFNTTVDRLNRNQQKLNETLQVQQQEIEELKKQLQDLQQAKLTPDINPAAPTSAATTTIEPSPVITTDQPADFEKNLTIVEQAEKEIGHGLTVQKRERIASRENFSKESAEFEIKRSKVTAEIKRNFPDFKGNGPWHAAVYVVRDGLTIDQAVAKYRDENLDTDSAEYKETEKEIRDIVAEFPELNFVKSDIVEGYIQGFTEDLMKATGIEKEGIKNTARQTFAGIVKSNLLIKGDFVNHD